MQTASIPVVTYALARPFARELENRQIPATPILRSVGLEPGALLDDDVFIAAQNWYDFSERAAEAANDPQFGFSIGAEAAIETLPNLRVLELPLATLGELLTALVIDVRRFSTIATYSLCTDGAVASLTTVRNFVPKERPAQIDGYFAGFMVRVLSLCSGNLWCPSELEISVSEPAALSKTVLKDCQVKQSGLEGASFRFPALWLLQRTDGALRQVKLTNAIASGTFLDAFGAMLDLHLERQGLSLDVFSGLTGQSKHSLKRRLRENGTTYQQELDRRRASRAMFLLQSTTMTTAEIGEKVGFPDPPSFSRAFKRWTSATPAQHRKLHST